MDSHKTSLSNQFAQDDVAKTIEMEDSTNRNEERGAVILSLSINMIISMIDSSEYIQVCIVQLSFFLFQSDFSHRYLDILFDCRYV